MWSQTAVSSVLSICDSFKIHSWSTAILYCTGLKILANNKDFVVSCQLQVM